MENEPVVISDDLIVQQLDAVWSIADNDYNSGHFPAHFTDEKLQDYLHAAMREFDPTFIDVLFRNVVGIIGRRTREPSEGPYFSITSDDVEFGQTLLTQTGMAPKLQLELGAPVVFKVLCVYKPFFTRL